MPDLGGHQRVTESENSVLVNQKVVQITIYLIPLKLLSEMQIFTRNRIRITRTTAERASFLDLYGRAHSISKMANGITVNTFLHYEWLLSVDSHTQLGIAFRSSCQ
jgi:hypothetical protein